MNSQSYMTKQDQIKLSNESRLLSHCSITVNACLVSPAYFSLWVTEVVSGSPNNLDTRWNANNKWNQWQCAASLNIQHNWHFRSFDGMQYCNNRWNEQPAKSRWLSEIDYVIMPLCLTKILQPKWPCILNKNKHCLIRSEIAKWY